MALSPLLAHRKPLALKLANAVARTESAYNRAKQAVRGAQDRVEQAWQQGPQHVALQAYLEGLDPTGRRDIHAWPNYVAWFLHSAWVHLTGAAPLVAYLELRLAFLADGGHATLIVSQRVGPGTHPGPTWVRLIPPGAAMTPGALYPENVVKVTQAPPATLAALGTTRVEAELVFWTQYLHTTANWGRFDPATLRWDEPQPLVFLRTLDTRLKGLTQQVQAPTAPLLRISHEVLTDLSGCA